MEPVAPKERARAKAKTRSLEARKGEKLEAKAKASGEACSFSTQNIILPSLVVSWSYRIGHCEALFIHRYCLFVFSLSLALVLYYAF
jgi:hypothetical protein